MRNIFKRHAQPAYPVSERVILENKYSSARYNLLIVAIFTLINVITVSFGGDSYFLVSAAVPYYIAFIGALMTGRLPAVYYEDSGFTEFLEPTFLVICAVIAVVLVALYLVFWFFSKKKPGMLIASLVFFALDTVFMLVIYGIAIDMIIDLLFHAWVIISLASGVRAYYKLKALPPDEPEPSPEEEFTNDFEYSTDDFETNNGEEGSQDTE